MRIIPISNTGRFYQTNQNTSFSGVSKVIKSKEYVGYGDFGGEQGDYNEYRTVVEYRPFADETKEEIANNSKALEDFDIITPNPYTYPSGYTVYPTSDMIRTEVVVGKPLNCTKEEARLVIEEYKKTV